MSIQHLLSPELDIDVKSLKINGVISTGDSAFVEFTPVITPLTPGQFTFTNTKSYYSQEGKTIELYITGNLLANGSTNSIQLILDNPVPNTSLVDLAGCFYNGGIVNTTSFIRGDLAGFTNGFATSSNKFLIVIHLTNSNTVITENYTFNAKAISQIN